MTGREMILEQISNMDDDAVASLYSKMGCAGCVVAEYCNAEKNSASCDGIIKNYMKIEEV